MKPKLAYNFSRINMVYFVLQNSCPKFYPKNGSVWLFLVNQKLRRKHPVDHRHNYMKVSPLRSPTNFKKGVFSKKNANCLKIVFKSKVGILYILSNKNKLVYTMFWRIYPA